MSKTALVISGGGSKGAFAVGVLQHLVLDLGIRFDLVAGTSTGSAIAPLVVTDEVDELVRIYSSVSTPDVLTARPVAAAFLDNDSLFDSHPFWNLLGATMTASRVATVMSSQIQMFITTVNLRSGQVVHFQTGPDSDPSPESVVVRVTTRDQLMHAILASADEPALMPPVTMTTPGAPPGQYVDGGVRSVLSSRIALDNGATDLYLIVLSPENDDNDKDFPKLPGILLRTIDLFQEEIALGCVDAALTAQKAVRWREALKTKLMTRFQLMRSEVENLLASVGAEDPFATTRAATLHVIRPDCSLEKEFSTSGLEFDPMKMAGMMAKGRRRAREVLSAGG
ncbi:MAG TPA: patatin-like phospholipase family protein [Thermoanaerobaculia bacterium]|nr:patatin-like phospholipase family protein [Thermoanaerobaculia bacterium]